MTRKTLVLTALVTLAATAPAAAALFTVRLHNGATFETRYQPQEAAWSADVVTFLSETGNWVALHREEISEITSSAESRGFARQIDTTTLDLGLAPNDRPEGMTPQGPTLEEAIAGIDGGQFGEPTVADERVPGGGIPIFGGVVGEGVLAPGGFNPGLGPVTSPTPGTPPPAAPTPGAPSPGGIPTPTPGAPDVPPQ
jgi:hypothetical protein